jgi:NAD-dependent dihydropyrimidine dehydrogenase PreA subunit
VAKVTIDTPKCDGCGTCVSVCPVAVFELRKLPEYGDKEKAVVVNNDACIACMACTVQCSQQCITVTE